MSDTLVLSQAPELWERGLYLIVSRKIHLYQLSYKISLTEYSHPPPLSQQGSRSCKAIRQLSLLQDLVCIYDQNIVISRAVDHRAISLYTSKYGFSWYSNGIRRLCNKLSKYGNNYKYACESFTG